MSRAQTYRVLEPYRARTVLLIDSGALNRAGAQEPEPVPVAVLAQWLEEGVEGDEKPSPT